MVSSATQAVATLSEAKACCNFTAAVLCPTRWDKPARGLTTARTCPAMYGVVDTNGRLERDRGTLLWLASTARNMQESDLPTNGKPTHRSMSGCNSQWAFREMYQMW